MQIFLSSVSAEFRSVRDALRLDLERPNVSVKVQEDFIAGGGETLEKLDDYIRHCHAVIHLVGDMTGASAGPGDLAAMLRRYPDLAGRVPPLAACLAAGAAPMSYTQWEAWLAIHHRKTLLIAVPQDDRTPRDAQYQRREDECAAQRAHLARLREAGRHAEIRFADANRLAVDVLRSSLHDILALAGPPRRPANLLYPSLGGLFSGRQDLLDALATGFGPIPRQPTPAVARVLSGLGGIGKTRLALEYAWLHSDRYGALLFVDADGPEALQRNLAALCMGSVLDLPEKTEVDESRQRDVVLSWLQRHSGWLLILDNIDSPEAAAAAEALLPRLYGGHVLMTSRLSQWSAHLRSTALQALSTESAAAFLLARTDARRRHEPSDATVANTLAGELGCLPLALEQAGAYVGQRRLSLNGYVADWQRQRDKVLAWYDARLMGYPTSVAVTWQTSFDQLGELARRLLRLLAWLAPEPIPESLLDVPLSSDDGPPVDTPEALAELESYSLVTRASGEPAFIVHGLVQEVTRRGQTGAPPAALVEALRWIDAAFVGEPDDMRDWPRLDPLVPHARSIAGRAAGFAIAAPTSRLVNQVAFLMHAKGRYAQAEPLMRQALAIDRASLGAAHPQVAVRLGNLAQLLHDTNRPEEAEPLMREALAIVQTSFGDDDPNVAIRLNNLAILLKTTNRLQEAEPLLRRALAIREASVGAEHPTLAVSLNNLAMLLRATNRSIESEPLMRRALTIDEAAFGGEHPNVARHLDNLAMLLKATNRHREAEPLMRRALAIDERSLGPEHLRLALRLNNLAALLKATNRLQEAEPLMQRALAICMASFGPQHPATQQAAANLARLGP